MTHTATTNVRISQPRRPNLPWENMFGGTGLSMSTPRQRSDRSRSAHQW